MVYSTGSLEILGYLSEKGTARYKDLKPFASTYTLNFRLKQFLKFNLIRHQFLKEDTRKEWYELTNKGRRFHQLLQKAIAVLESDEESEIADNKAVSDKT